MPQFMLRLEKTPKQTKQKRRLCGYLCGCHFVPVFEKVRLSSITPQTPTPRSLQLWGPLPWPPWAGEPGRVGVMDPLTDSVTVLPGASRQYTVSAPGTCCHWPGSGS